LDTTNCPKLKKNLNGTFLKNVTIKFQRVKKESLNNEFVSMIDLLVIRSTTIDPADNRILLIICYAAVLRHTSIRYYRAN
jgi:hypothetical protein